LTIEDAWELVWDKLVSITRGMDEFIDKGDQVFYGPRFPPTKFPSAFVIPTPVTGSPATPSKEDYYLQFTIGLVMHNADMKAGLVAVMKLALKLKRLIIADRNLTDNGSQLVENTEVPEVIPNWLGAIGYEDQWAGVVVRCRITE